MLTRLTIRNFKRFDEVEIELGSRVVFIGPNNSGKTTALQALALWDVGLRKWTEKRGGKAAPEKRPGVTINRRDLIAVPIPDSNLLWREMKVRDVSKVNGKQETKNIRISVVVDGVTEGVEWSCGLEFDYANEESFYCRPLRLNEAATERMSIPAAAPKTRIAFLPPMSGLAANERRLDPGALNVNLGEGRTAEVLRNLCQQVVESPTGIADWKWICDQVESLFGVRLDVPKYIAERGEITMTYRDPSGVRLDLSSSGRGLQQTLLLLTHLTVHPGSVLLLDEPDAHLEFLRQAETYELITRTADQQGSQIIAASHSEVLLNEAADRDIVVAFLGRPHRIDDRAGSQVLKSLKEIGFQDYYKAEQTGWVLYLEGSTDLAILRALADTLDHPARKVLARPFFRYVANKPSKARDHFYGLREAKKDLVGYALFDRLETTLQVRPELVERMWTRREIENYLCQPETLVAYASASGSEAAPGPLFEATESQRRIDAMKECIEDFVPRAALRDGADSWWSNTKASDDFLDKVFACFFGKLKLPNLMPKTDYHILARFVAQDSISSEISEVLDGIVRVAASARAIQ